MNLRELTKSSGVYNRQLRDGVALSAMSTDEEQIEAFTGLMLKLQPLYYPMSKEDADDLAHDFWLYLNEDKPFCEQLDGVRNVPSAVKTWAIRWLQNLNKSKHFDYTLSQRLREEMNRATGKLDLMDYMDEAYNRIYSDRRASCRERVLRLV